jgi:hypothetical protein
MAALRFPLDASLTHVLDHNSFTLGELTSHPLAVPLISQFDAFQAKWFTTFAARAALQIIVGKSEGAIVGADTNLGGFIDTLDRTLLILTKNDRAAVLYRFYFGVKTASERKQLVLADKLVTVKGWVASLQGSPHAALTALATSLIELIAAADAVIKKHQDAAQALKDFDMLGGKKALIDEFNALRQTAYGELAAMPHEHPNAMLPPNFADRFFRHEPHKGITAITNPEIVQTKISSIEKKLIAAKSHLEQLKKEAKEKEAAEVVQREDEAALDAARANEIAAKQSRKELEKKVKADKKKTKKA